MEYWIQTFTGKIFDYDKIELNEIDIIDIAHALSNTCRFNGHCSEFYSVAEHSVEVAMQLPPELRLAGLLHDATEAYMPDISKPLKGYLNLFFNLEEFEDRISRHIYKQLGVPINDEIWKEIKLYDFALLREERNLLFRDKKLWEFPKDIPVVKATIEPLMAEDAEIRFLSLYDVLKNK